MSNTAPKSKKRKRRRQSGFVKLLIALMIIAILGAVCYTLSVTVLFNIAKIEVKGETQYPNSDIIEASGIQEGTNMHLIKTESAELSITSKLPYIGKAKINRKYPDTIVITVSPCKADCAYKTSKGYLTACGDKILDEVSTKPKDLPLIVAKIDRYAVGSEIVLKKGMNDALETVRKEIARAGIKGITAIDVKNVAEIEVTVDDKIVLQIGTTENLEKKCKNAAKIIEVQRKKHGTNVEGYVNLRYLTGDSNNSYFTRKSIHADEELTKSE